MEVLSNMKINRSNKLMVGDSMFTFVFFIKIVRNGIRGSVVLCATGTNFYSCILYKNLVCYIFNVQKCKCTYIFIFLTENILILSLKNGLINLHKHLLHTCRLRRRSAEQTNLQI